MQGLYRIRSRETEPVRLFMRRLILLLVCGAVLGAAAKLLDKYSEVLGNMFSELTVWFLLGTWIAVRSASPMRAGIRTLVFCAGMLAAYYAAAELLQMPWSGLFARSWAVFAIVLPVFAFGAWFARGHGRIALLLRAGIIVVAFLAQAVLFRIRVSDVALLAALAAVLFRQGRGRPNRHAPEARR